MDLSAAMESLIATSIGTTMLSLGLGLQVSALKDWWERPWLPLRVLVGSCALVPLAGLLLLHAPWSWSIARPVRQAIALMAICPSAPLALRKARGLGGDQQLAALVQMGAALLAIITIPLLGALYRWSFGVGGWDVLPRHVALQVSRIQVLPLLVGLGLRTGWPQLADRVSSPLSKLAHGLLLLMLVVVLAIAAPLLWEFLPGNRLAFLTMLLLAVLALWIGWALAGRTSQQGRTTAVVTAMRNPGLALLFATEHSSDLRTTTAAILMYVLVTLVLLQIVLRPERPAIN
ncbi:MAG: bile acid:sodium symporter [Synechococcaceae cyanobacterium]|nr:bile acid:sodium symporter [Synechococcaceae cyanobacterium]